MNEFIAPAKIQRRHLERWAVVYVRQSHPQQIVKHPESAATQRRLRERVEQWGWPADQIRVLEGDQGKSGTTTVGRDEFAWLLSEVTLGHVGLVAGFQVNRLAREDEAICRLIKVCSMFDTLLADQDGLYDPEDFNDRLVLTIKGVVGGVELHQIQQRMQHGRLERARRGEWQGATPVGYVVGPDRKLAFDPDEQVQQAVRQVFTLFAGQGSVSALLRYCRQHDLRLPIREPTAGRQAQIEWRRPHRETLRKLLRHPAYAGVFTWGRSRTDHRRAQPGRRGTGRVTHQPDQALVFLPDNHPAYIDWDHFQRNVRRLTSHRRHGPEPSGRREVVSLLAGRVVCGNCGHRMQARYTPQLRYECARLALDYGEPACTSLSGEEIERLLVQRLLAALEPASVQLSLAACDQIESQRADLDRQWQLRLERAELDAARAFRQFDQVEPENRLVVRTLERQWEQTLQTVRTLQDEYDRFRAARPVELSRSERESIVALSHDLPRLWHLPSTTIQDKRRVVQLMLEKAVVTNTRTEQVSIDLHWVGGTVTRDQITRRIHRWENLSNYQEILHTINELITRGAASDEIADHLNRSGYKTCRGTAFNASNIRQLRSRIATKKKKRRRNHTV